MSCPPLTILPLLAGPVTRDQEEFVTELRHMPEGWLAVAGFALLAGVCWAVVWMYRREGRIGASLWVRMTLAVVRCAVLVTLAVILLEPVRVRILRRWVDSYTVVLTDDSSSMDLADAYRDESAAQRVKRVLGTPDLSATRRTSVVEQVFSKNDKQFLRSLADSNRVKLYAFSDEPRLLATIRATRESGVGRTDTSDSIQTLLSVDEAPTEMAGAGAATNIERACIVPSSHWAAHRWRRLSCSATAGSTRGLRPRRPGDTPAIAGCRFT